MNKQLVAFAAIFVTCSGAPALAQEVQVSSVEAQEAVRTYDSCLAKAIVRAERAGTPLELQHDMSVRACERVRSSLLSDAKEAAEVASALDAVDQVRQGHLHQLAQAGFEGEFNRRPQVGENRNAEWYGRQAQAQETRPRSQSPSR